MNKHTISSVHYMVYCMMHNHLYGLKKRVRKAKRIIALIHHYKRFK